MIIVGLLRSHSVKLKSLSQTTTVGLVVLIVGVRRDYSPASRERGVKTEMDCSRGRTRGGQNWVASSRLQLAYILDYAISAQRESSRQCALSAPMIPIESDRVILHKCLSIKSSGHMPTSRLCLPNRRGYGERRDPARVSRVGRKIDGGACQGVT